MSYFKKLKCQKYKINLRIKKVASFFGKLKIFCLNKIDIIFFLNLNIISNKFFTDGFVFLTNI